MSDVDSICTELLKLCVLLSGAREHLNIIAGIAPAAEVQKHLKEVERLYEEVVEHLKAIESTLGQLEGYKV